MANVKTILGADVVKFAANQDGFNPVFRKVIDVVADGIGSSDYYAIARLPVGFAPRTAAVLVKEDLATSNSNVTVALTIGSAGSGEEDDLVDDTTILAASGTNHKAGTVTIASLVGGTVASTAATLNPVVVSGDTPVYVWAKFGSGVVKGKLEITVAGDQMVEPSQVL